VDKTEDRQANPHIGKNRQYAAQPYRVTEVTLFWTRDEAASKTVSRQSKVSQQFAFKEQKMLIK